ncbi:MAG: exonuclease subunit SbcD [Candidatus Electrothrix sp. AR3]|nr:exonuclease subunit SbcD [Candidatus Electrothrix sp. AR3]
MNKLRVLHTSDWHLGRTLYGRHRYGEFKALLNWLYDTILAHKVDILLIAGDIFHTATPSNRSQQLYYNFLCRVAATSCRHLVVTAGNHDSPTFLNAPKDLLRILDIHVIAAAQPGSLADEVIPLRNQTGAVEAIICAVPFLRDREVRRATVGQNMDDRERELVQGIRQHYQQVCAAAEEQQNKLAQPVPMIGMGHLFTAGGSKVEGDGVRSLYVGSLACVGADIFPESLDYLALGHLHSPQKVGGNETRRYSGAPLVMGFGEAEKKKSICLISFGESAPSVETLTVPVFQKIRRIQGDWPHIAKAISALAQKDQNIWLEIIYQGEELISDLRQRLEEAIAATPLEVLRIRNRRIIERSLEPKGEHETLAELGHQEVFNRCLDAHAIPPDQRPSILAAYNEIAFSLEQADPRAE